MSALNVGERRHIPRELHYLIAGLDPKLAFLIKRAAFLDIRIQHRPEEFFVNLVERYAVQHQSQVLNRL